MPMTGGGISPTHPGSRGQYVVQPARSQLALLLVESNSHST